MDSKNSFLKKLEKSSAEDLQSLFSSLIESHTAPIFIVEKTKILDANLSSKTLLGEVPKDVLSMLNPTSQIKFQKALKKCKKKEEQAMLELKVGDEVKMVKATFNSLPIQDKKVVQVAFKELNFDVTAEFGDLEMIAESLPNIMLFKFEKKEDGSYHFPYVSMGSTQAVGITPANVMKSKGFDALEIHPQDLPHLIKSVEQSSNENIEWNWVGRSMVDGKTNWLKLTAVPEKNDAGGTVWTGSIVNFDDMVKNDEELDKLSFVANKTNNAIVILDSEGKITWANDAYLNLSQYSFDELNEQSPLDVLGGEETNPEHIKAIKDGLASGNAFQQEILYYTKEGNTYWVEVNITPIQDNDGNVEKFISIDIERSPSETVQSVDTTNSLDLDLNDGSFLPSPQLLSILGYKEGEFDKKTDALFLEEDYKVFEEALESLKAGKNKSFEKELRLLDKDNSTLWMLVKSSVVMDEEGKPSKVISSFLDISRFKAQEEALKTQNDELKALDKKLRKQIKQLEANSKKTSKISLEKDQPKPTESEPANVTQFAQYHQGIIELIKSDEVNKDGQDKAFEYITKRVAEISGASRVGIWVLNDDVLTCQKLSVYDEFEEGMTINTDEDSFFEKLMDDDEAISVDDTTKITDQHMSAYFKGLGVKSVAFVPYYLNGNMAGVVSAEYQETSKTWRPEDLAFLTATSDVVSYAITASEKTQTSEEKPAQTLSPQVVSQNPNLELHKQRLDTLLNLNPDLVFFKDENGIYLEVNESMAKANGLTVEEMIGKSDFELFPEELAKKIYEGDQAVIQSGKALVTEDWFEYPDGKKVYYESTKIPTDGGVVVICKDITHRAKLLEQERSERQRYRSAIKGSKDGIWDWNIHTNDVFFSSKAIKMLGYDTDELPNNYGIFQKVLNKEDFATVDKALQTFINDDSQEFSIETRMISKSGIDKWVIINAAKVENEKGQIMRITGSLSNISKEKEFENYVVSQNEVIQDRQTMLQTLLDDNNDAVLLIDLAKNQNFYINQVGLKLFGHSEEDILKFNNLDLSAEDQIGGTADDLYQQHIQKCLQDGHARFEWFSKKANGDIFESEISLSKIPLEGKDIIQAIIRDISANKKLLRDLKAKNEELLTTEEELRQTLEEAQSQNEFINQNPALLSNIENLKPEHREELEELRKIKNSQQLTIQLEQQLNQRQEEHQKLLAQEAELKARIETLQSESNKQQGLLDKGDETQKEDINIELLTSLKEELKSSKELIASLTLKLESKSTLDTVGGSTPSDNTLELQALKQDIKASKDLVDILSKKLEEKKAIKEASEAKEQELQNNLESFKKEQQGVDQIKEIEALKQQQDSLKKASQDLVVNLNYELASKQALVNSIIEGSADSIFIFDQSGSFLFCNQTAIRTFGIESKAKVGQTKISQISSENQILEGTLQESIDKHIAKALSSSKHTFEWKSQTLDGKEFDSEVVLSQIQKDGEVVILCNIRDISNRTMLLSKLQGRKEKTEVYNKATIELHKLQAVKDGNLDLSFKEISKIASIALGVDRFSIWDFDSDQKSITSLINTDRDGDDFQYNDGLKITYDQAPIYLDEISKEQTEYIDISEKIEHVDEFIKQHFLAHNIQVGVSVPYFVDGKVGGAISLGSKDDQRDWSSEDLSFVKSIGDLVVLCLVNAANIDNTQKLQDYQNALFALSKENAVNSGNLDKALEFIVQKGAQQLGADRLAFWKYAEDPVRLEPQKFFQAINGKQELIDGYTLTQDEAPTLFKEVETNNIFISDDSINDERLSDVKHIMLENNIQSVLAVPVLNNKGDLTGILSATTVARQRKWTSEDISFVKSLADVIDIAENAAHAAEISQTMLVQNQRAKHFQEVLFEITRNDSLYQADLEGSYKYITKTIADTLQIERTSIWLKTEKEESLTSAMVYDVRAEEVYSVIPEIYKTDHPDFYSLTTKDREALIPDVFAIPQYDEYAEKYCKPVNIKAVMTIPVYQKGVFAGVILSASQNVKEWHTDEVSFVKSIADILSAALQSSDQQKRKQRVEFLNESLVELSKNPVLRNTNVEEIYDTFNYHITNILDVSRTAVWLFNDQGDQLNRVNYFERSKLVDDGLPRVDTLILKDYPQLYNHLKEGNDIDASDVFSQEYLSEFSDSYLKTYNIKSLLGTPLFKESRFIGMVLCTQSHEAKEWMPEERSFLKTSSDIIVNAVRVSETAKRNEQIKANQDILLRLSSSPDVNGGDQEKLLEVMSKTILDQLTIDSVSIWIFDREKGGFACEEFSDSDKERETTLKDQLFKEEYDPVYFETLSNNTSIIANDVTQHPKITSLYDIFLEPSGVKSLMAMPFMTQGQMNSTVTCTTRFYKDWQPEEINFLRASIDILVSGLSICNRIKKDNLAKKYQVAAMQISNDPLITAKQNEAFAFITKSTCQTLNVNKAGIFLYEIANQSFSEHTLFDKDQDKAIFSEIEISATNTPVLYQALTSQNVLQINDINTSQSLDEDLKKNLLELGVTSMLCTPFHFKGNLAGALIATLDHPHNWIFEELNFLSTIGDITVSSINVTKEAEKEELIRTRQDLLLMLSRDPIISSGEIRSAYQFITESVAKHLKVNRASIWKIDKSNHNIYLDAIYDIEADALLPIKVSFDPQKEQEMHKAFSSKSSVVIPDTTVSEILGPDIMKYMDAQGVKALLLVPIYNKGELTGSFMLSDNKPRDWNIEDTVFLQSVGEIINTVISIADNKSSNEKKAFAQDALLQLSRNEVILAGDKEASYKLIVKEMVRIYDVSRASIWAYTKDDSGDPALIKQMLFDADKDYFDEGTEVSQSKFPILLEYISEGKSIVANDMNHPALVNIGPAVYQANNVKSTLLVPYHIEGQVKGMMVLSQRDNQKEWDEVDLETAANFNDIILSSTYAVERFEKEKRQKAFQDCLIELGKNPIIMSGDLDEAFELIAKTGAIQLNSSRFSIWYYAKDLQQIELLKGYTLALDEYDEGLSIPRDQDPNYFDGLLEPSGIVVNSINDFEADAPILPILQQMNISAFATLPYYNEGEAQGIVNATMHGTPRVWSVEETNFLKSISDIVTIAMGAHQQNIIKLELQSNRTMILKEAEKLSSIMENIPDIVYLKDHKSKYVEVNRAFLDYVGHDRVEDVVGKTDFDLFPEDLAQKFVKEDQSVRQSQKQLTFISHSEIGEELIILENTKTPVGDNLLGISRDITERQKLTEEIDRQKKSFQALFDTNQDAIVILAHDAGSITNCNYAAVTLFGFESKEELLGQSPITLSPEYQKGGKSDELAVEYITKARDGETQNFEWVHLRNGEAFDAGVTLNPVTIDGENVVQAIIRDITEHKKLMHQVYSKNEELLANQEELRQNMEELQSQRDFIEKVNRDVVERNRRTERYNTILMELNKDPRLVAGDLDQALVAITETMSRALKVQAGGVWRFLNGGDTLESLKLVDTIGDLNNETYKEGLIIPAEADPVYFGHLKSEQPIVANDIFTHKAFGDNAKSFFREVEIISNLTYPFMVDGEIAGIIAASVRKEARSWTREDQVFIKSLADTCAIAFVNAREKAATREKEESNRRTERYNKFLLELNKDPRLLSEDLQQALTAINETAVNALDIEGASVWQYSEDPDGITALNLVNTDNLEDAQEFQPGAQLLKELDPKYFDYLQSEKPIIAHDTQDHDAHGDYAKGFFKKLGILSNFTQPFLIDGKIAGVVGASTRKEARDWSREDQVFMKSLADICSIAFINAREKAATREKEESNRRAQKFNQVLLDTNKDPRISSGDLQVALDFIGQTIGDVLDTKVCLIWEYVPNEELIKCVSNVVNKNVAIKDIPLGTTYVSETGPHYFNYLKSERSVIADDVFQHPAHEASEVDFYKTFNIKSSMSFPFFVQGNWGGVIYAHSVGEQRHWNEEEQAFMKSMADLVSVAYATSREKALLKEIEERNKRTDLFNQKILELSRQKCIIDGDMPTTYRLICNTMVEVLGTKYSNAWIYHEQPESIECVGISDFKGEGRALTVGFSFEYEQDPIYFEYIKSEKSVVAQDLSDHEAHGDFTKVYYQQLGLKSGISTPFFVDGKMSGFITTTTQESRYWNPEEIGFVKSLADLTAVAYTNAREKVLLTEIEERNKRAEQYNKVLLALNKDKAIISGNIKDTLNLITKTISEQLGDVGSIWEYSSDPQSLDTLSYCDTKGEYLTDPLTFNANDQMYFGYLKKARSIIADDINDHPAHGDAVKDFYREHDIKSNMAIPYFVDGKLSGMVCAYAVGEPKAWTKEDSTFLKSIADVITLTFVSAREKDLIQQQEDRNKRTEQYNKALLALNKDKAITSGNIKEALDHITKTIAEQLGVDGSIWEYTTDPESLDNLSYCNVKGDYVADIPPYNAKDELYFSYMRRSRSVIADDVNDHPAHGDAVKDFYKQYEVKSNMSIPYFVDGELGGKVCAYAIGEPKAWTKEDSTFLKSISDIITLAFASAREKAILKELELKNEKSERYNQSLLALSKDKRLASGDLDDVFRMLSSETVSQLDAYRATVYKYDRERNLMISVVTCTSNTDGQIEFTKGVEYPVSNFPKFVKLLETKEAVVTREIASGDEMDDALKKAFSGLGILSNVSVPIYEEGEFVGFISMSSQKEDRVWTQEDIAYFKSIADMVVLANAAAREKGFLKDLEEKKILSDRYNNVLLALNKDKRTTGGDLQIALQAITEAIITTLDVNFGTIWRYDQEPEQLALINMAFKDGDDIKHRGGEAFPFESAPTYFQYLKTDRDIIAPDITKHETHTEAVLGYYQSINVQAAMNIPFYVDGNLAGKVGAYHSSIRQWTAEDKAFMKSISDIVALAYAAARQQSFLSEIELQATKLDTIMNNLVDIVYYKDPNGVYIDVNEAYMELVPDLTKDDIIGKTDHDIFPKEIADTYRNHDIEIMESGVTSTVIEPAIIHGEERIMDSVKKSVKGGILGISRDVTERVQLLDEIQQSQTKLSSVMNSIPDLIYLKNDKGEYIQVNQAHVDINNAKSDSEILGKTDFDLFPEEVAKEYAEEDKLVLQKGEKMVFINHSNIDGEDHIFETTKIPVGKAVLGVTRDVTQQRTLLNQVKESGEKLEQIMDNLVDIVYVKDADGVYVDVNEAYLELTEYTSKEQIIGKTDHDLYDKEIADGFRENDLKVMQSGLTETMIEPIIVRGEHRTHESTKRPLNDGILGISRNVTEREKLMNEVKESQTKLSSVMNNIPDLIYMKNEKGEYIQLNQAHLEFNGAQLESEILGKTDFDLFPEEVANEFAEEDKLVLQKGEKMTFVNNSIINDKLVIFETTKIPVGNNVLGVSRDVTQQRTLLNQVKESGEKLEQIMDNLVDIVYVKDADGVYVDVNEAYLELTEYTSKEQIIGKTDHDLYDKEIADGFRENDLKVMQSGLTETMIEPIIVRGEQRTHESTKRPLNDGILGISRNVTERERLMNEIKESQTKLSSVMNNIPDLIYMKNEKGEYIQVNQAHLEFNGAQLESEILGKTDFDLFPEEAANEFVEEDKLVLQKGEKMVFINHSNIDGKDHIFETTKIPVGKNILGVTRDVTQQRTLLNQVKESGDKLEEIMDNLVDIVYVKDADGVYVDINNAYLELTEYTSKEQIIGKTDYDLYPKEIADGFRENDLKIIQSGTVETSIEPIIVRGEHRIHESTKKELNGGVLGISRNVTERQRLLDEIQAQKERMQTIWDSNRDAMALIDFETGLHIDCNPAILDLYGYTREELFQLTPIDVSAEYQEDGRLSTEAIVEDTSHAIEHGSTSFEWLSKRKDGSTVNTEITLTKMIIDGREAILCTIRDITERKALADQIQAQQVRMQTIWDSNRDASVLLDIETGTFIDCNPAALALYGYSKEEMLQLSPLDVSPEYQEDGRLSADAIVEDTSYAIEHGSTSFEWLNKRKDGSTVNTEISLTMMIIDGKDTILCAVRDITERKALMNQIMENNSKLQANEEEMRQNMEELQSQRDYIERVNRETVEKNKVTRAFQRALIDINKEESVINGDLDKAFEVIVQHISRRLNVSRSSIWIYEQEPSPRVIQQKLYAKGEGLSAQPVAITKDDAINYIEAIEEAQNIVASDSLAHNVLGHYANKFLNPYHIKSTLIVPFLSEGKLGGVLQAEQAYDYKEWTIEDVQFLKSIADIITVTQATAREKIVQKELANLSSFQSSIFNASQVIITPINEEGILTLFNPVAEQMLGFTSEEVVGKKGPEIFLDENEVARYAEELSQEIGKEVQGLEALTYKASLGEIANMEVAYKRKDGTTFPVSLTVTAIKDTQGNITGYLGIAEDITERKELLQQILAKNEELQVSEEELHQNFEELKSTQEKMAKQNIKLDIQNTAMTKSIQYAKTIQNTVLPSKELQEEMFSDSFLIYRPKDIVSGDFYWLSQHDRKRIRIVGMIDCTGHGVPGAFMSLIGHNILSDTIIIQGVRSPGQILNQLHDGICDKLDQRNGKNKDGMDLGFLKTEEIEGGKVRITFAGARNNLYYISGGEFYEVRGERRPIGGVYAGEDRDYKDIEIILHKGDVVYMVTDGFADQANPKRESFGKGKLRELFKKHYAKPMNVQKAFFEQALDEHQGPTEQRDDITLIGFVV